MKIRFASQFLVLLVVHGSLRFIFVVETSSLEEIDRLVRREHHQRNFAGGRLVFLVGRKYPHHELPDLGALRAPGLPPCATECLGGDLEAYYARVLRRYRLRSPCSNYRGTLPS